MATVLEAFVGAFGGMLAFWALMKIIAWYAGEKVLLQLIHETVEDACQRVHDASDRNRH